MSHTEAMTMPSSWIFDMKTILHPNEIEVASKTDVFLETTQASYWNCANSETELFPCSTIDYHYHVFQN